MTGKTYKILGAMNSFLAVTGPAAAAVVESVPQIPSPAAMPDFGLLGVMVALATLIVIIVGIFIARYDARQITDAIQHGDIRRRLEKSPR